MTPLSKQLLFGAALIIICALMWLSTSFLMIIFGVCIFLYAMGVLEKSFSYLTSLEAFLKKATKRRSMGFLFGFTTTTLMQSSGLVSVLAISFLSAGLITLAGGLSIIYGANLGTITGAWLVAGFGLKVNIAHYAMPMIIIGIVCIANKADAIKGSGYFLFSLGMLFLGISYMKGGFDDIKDTIDLSQYAMTGVGGLLVYTLIGLVMTVIMQSSHATLTIAITALSVGQITYENSIAIAIGSNVGSTVMAVIGSLNANVEGRKLTIAHVIFNVVSAIVTLLFVKFFIWLTDLTALYTGVADDDYTIKLSIFHSYFNITGVLIFYPLTGVMERFLNKYVKPNPKRSKIATAQFLNAKALNFGETSVAVLLREVRHLHENAISIIAKSISVSKSDFDSPLGASALIATRQQPIRFDYDELYNNRFKVLYSQIIEFSIQASAIAKKHDMVVLMDIKRISTMLAESLKEMRSSQPNFFKFMTSGNEYIKFEYDKLRIKIFKMLRVINAVIRVEDGSFSRKDLKKLKSIYQDLASGESAVSALLHSKKISATMATSLINDLAITASITKTMLTIVEHILTHDKQFPELSAANLKYIKGETQ